MRGIWHNAWLSLRRGRLRTWLTVSSIAIGTGMVILILGISGMGTRAVSRELESMGVNGLSVSSSKGLNENCLTRLRDLSTVSAAMPLSIQMGSASLGVDNYNVVSCGIDAGADQVISLELLHGRMLMRGDVAGEGPVCVIDAALAQEAYGRDNVVGKTLSITYEKGKQDYTVVGVTATGSSLLQNVTAMIPYMVYVPYTTQRAVTGVETFDQIAVRLTSEEASQAAEDLIQQTLARSGEDVGTLLTENLATQRDRLYGMMNIITLVLAAVGGVSLLVSGFGILTVMLSSVTERTREIGIKKAIGATRGWILAEFLAGAMLLSGLGALGGIALGGGVVAVACGVMGFPFSLPLGKVLGVFLLTVVLGMAFGAYPAYQAAGLQPVKALRYEG